MHTHRCFFFWTMWESESYLVFFMPLYCSIYFLRIGIVCDVATVQLWNSGNLILKHDFELPYLPVQMLSVVPITSFNSTFPLQSRIEPTIMCRLNCHVSSVSCHWEQFLSLSFSVMKLVLLKDTGQFLRRCSSFWSGLLLAGNTTQTKVYLLQNITPGGTQVHLSPTGD